MPVQNSSTEHRGYVLVSRFNAGEFRGRGQKGKDRFDVLGSSLEDVVIRLKSQVDARLDEIIAARLSAPSSTEYVEAVRKILVGLSDGHIAMLRAHYMAPNRSITATQLAEAAGYKVYGAANLQCGLVGKALFEELPVKLPKRADGTLIYTSALAEAGDRTEAEDHWVWKMRPEVADAIREVGLVG